MRNLAALLIALTSALPAAAQSLNIDCGTVAGTPLDTYVGASGQAGYWNAIGNQPQGQALQDLVAGNTTVTMTSYIANWAFWSDNPGTSGDDQALMDDGADGSGTISFAGLAPGDYVLTTFAWAPDSNTYVTNVSVPGSPDPAQDVGGAWPGGFVLGVTHALHRYTVGVAGTLDVVLTTTSGFSTTNGFQLERADRCSGVVYCAAKVNSLGCVPAIGFSGIPSISCGVPYFITASSVRNNKAGLLFYSVTGGAALPFQCGTLCVAPPIKRTPAQFAGGTPPPAQDCTGAYSIDFNAFSLGLLGGTPHPALVIAGTTVWSQWWSRDKGFPAPCNTGLTDGLLHTRIP